MPGTVRRKTIKLKRTVTPLGVQFRVESISTEGALPRPSTPNFKIPRGTPRAR